MQKSTYCPEQSRRDNGDAHLTRQVMSAEVVVALASGCLDSGPPGQTFFWGGSTDGGGNGC